MGGGGRGLLAPRKGRSQQPKQVPEVGPVRASVSECPGLLSPGFCLRCLSWEWDEALRIT